MFVWILATLLASAADQPTPISSLSTARAVRELPHAQAARAIPVKLTGVVTHANPALGDFFIQDDTAGIYVHPTTAGRDLTAGDRVAVTGRSSPGAFSPCVTAQEVRKLGRGPLPEPEPYDLHAADSRWLDAQYVQVWAWVRNVTVGQGFTTLAVVTSAGTGMVRIPGEEHGAGLAAWSGRTVRIRGVCVPHFNTERQLTEDFIWLFVQSPAELTVAPPVRERDTPAPIGMYLKGFSTVPHPSAWPVTLEGVVTATVGPRNLFLQDQSSGVFVVAGEHEETRVEVGDRVVAKGFLRVEGPRVLLTQASLRRLGAGALPQPLAAAVPFFTPERTFARLIQVEGVVEESALRDQAFVLNLYNGPTRFRALLVGQGPPAELTGLEPGARVSVTGVAFAFRQLLGNAEAGPAVVLRSAADVAVLARPPAPLWWTARRVGWLLAGATGSVAAVGLWVGLLRRQVRKQTAEIKAYFDREARLEESLRQVRKLEAVGRLVGGIAHDFNNLLTVIIGNGDLAAQSLAGDHPAFERVEVIRDAGAKAAALTAQLLTFSRQQPVTLAPLDLNATLADAEKLLRRLIGEHIHLQTRYAPGLPAALADPVLVHQIVFNLAANARDAMPEGGELLLQTSLGEPVGSRPGVRLTVTDSGCGMDEATQARIFEPFFTTKEVGKGTGLGLATVYGIVKTLGGTIAVRSAVGVGTTFTIDLPPADQVAAALPPAPASTSHGEGSVVLLVEDEERVRKVCALTLAMSGYHVLEAESPAAALEVAQAAAGPIHLLVTDIVMPGMNGRDLAVAVGRLRPEIRTLFMSGYPKEEVARMVGDLPGTDFIQKPFSPLQLAAVVQDCLESAAPIETG
jgi:signal transduction histidine kinase/CheY-like chemotaxis protein